jgi:hypothetical protein
MQGVEGLARDVAVVREDALHRLTEAGHADRVRAKQGEDITGAMTDRQQNCMTFGFGSLAEIQEELVVPSRRRERAVGWIPRAKERSD